MLFLSSTSNTILDSARSNAFILLVDHIQDQRANSLSSTMHSQRQEAGGMKALVLPFQLTGSDRSPALPPAACHVEIGSCSWMGHGSIIHRHFLNPQPAFQGRYPEMDWFKTPLPSRNGEIPGACYTQMACPTTLLRIRIGDY